MDDELNVLPLSKGKDLQVGRGEDDDRGRKRKAEELKDMKESLDGVDIAGALAKLTKTVDQVSFVFEQCRQTLTLGDFRQKRYLRSWRLSPKKHFHRQSRLLLREVEANLQLWDWQ